MNSCSYAMCATRRYGGWTCCSIRRLSRGLRPCCSLKANGCECECAVYCIFDGCEDIRDFIVAVERGEWWFRLKVG